jgi:hypothetical protein
MLKRVALSLTFFVAHAAVTFMAWSAMPGNAVGHGASWAPPVWNTFSFPVFRVLASDLVNRHFGLWLCVNSALWAACATAAYAWIRGR